MTIRRVHAQDDVDVFRETRVHAARRGDDRVVVRENAGSGVVMVAVLVETIRRIDLDALEMIVHHAVDTACESVSAAG